MSILGTCPPKGIPLGVKKGERKLPLTPKGG